MFRVNKKDPGSSGTYFTSCSSVSIVNFEQVNAGRLVTSDYKIDIFGSKQWWGTWGGQANFSGSGGGSPPAPPPTPPPTPPLGETLGGYSELI